MLAGRALLTRAWPTTAHRCKLRRAGAAGSRRWLSADWLGDLRPGGSRYSVSVRPEDYSLIVDPGESEGGVDHDALLASEHKAFVIASLMNPDRCCRLPYCRCRRRSTAQCRCHAHCWRAKITCRHQRAN